MTFLAVVTFGTTAAGIVRLIHDGAPSRWQIASVVFWLCVSALCAELAS